MGEIQQLLDEEKLSRQTSEKRFKTIEQKFSMLKIGGGLNSSDTTKVSEPKIVAIAQGHKLFDEEFANIKESDFDVILNVPMRTLKARKDPVKRSKLEVCSRKNIGHFRLKLLVYLLEHSGVQICAENIPKVYGLSTKMSPSTLASAIKVFRRALKQASIHGPYILTEFVWGPSASHSGYFYKANHSWRYLVIPYE